MSHVIRAGAVIAALVTVAVPSLARARDVTRCGITIRAGKTGTLTRDVQCGFHCSTDPTVRCVPRPDPLDDPRCPIAGDSCSPDSILLERSATLDLNGFTLTTVYGETGIFCSEGRGKCTVKGGTLAGGKSASPIEPGDKDLILADLTIRRFYRVIHTTGRVQATNVALQFCEGGILGDKTVRAKGITLEPQCSLGSGRTLFVDGIDSSGYFGATETVRARNATIRFGSHVEGKNVALSRSAAVPTFPGDQSGFEIKASGKVVLRHSTVGGVQSGTKPKVIDSTCERSVKPDLTSTWGVCADD
jgi:hypothetical protein